MKIIIIIIFNVGIIRWSYREEEEAELTGMKDRHLVEGEGEEEEEQNLSN